MNILVLGGSYFLGKCFVKMAVGKHKITVLNRGNRTLEIEGIEVLQADRHDCEVVREKLKDKTFDVVVDFCAYQEGDISNMLASLSDKNVQYIFVSTVDIYRRGMFEILAEEAPFEERIFPGEAGEYIAGKVALEKEIRECAASSGMSYTIFRPAFIYGPDNYAPREGIYFNWIQQAGQILSPVDATGEFQMVYVEDVARAVLAAIGNKQCYDESYNLTGGRRITYQDFETALEKAVPASFERVEIPLSVVYEKGIPLPFPLTSEESNRYDGSKALSLVGMYIELSEGLRKTYLSINQL